MPAYNHQNQQPQLHGSVSIAVKLLQTIIQNVSNSSFPASGSGSEEEEEEDDEEEESSSQSEGEEEEGEEESVSGSGRSEQSAGKTVKDCFATVTTDGSVKSIRTA